MKKTLILLMAIIFFSACSTLPTVSDSDNKPKRGLFSSVRKFYYPDGSLREKETLVNGLLNGPATSYFQNGQVKREVTYVNNEIQGLDKTYFESGTLKTEANWEKGNLDGPYTVYCENGNIQETQHYLLGKLNGEATRYHDCSNTLAERKNYNNGKLEGEREIYYPDGKLKEKMIYENDTLNGLKSTFDPSGNQKEEETYAHGVLNGMCRYYYPRGSLMQEVNYLEGEKHGVEKLYHKRGNVQKETPYEDGLINGTVKQYAGSGYLWLIENYKWGQLHGKSIQYSKSGRVMKEVNYVAKNIKKPERKQAVSPEEVQLKEQKLIEQNIALQNAKKKELSDAKVAQDKSDFFTTGLDLQYRLVKTSSLYYGIQSNQKISTGSGTIGVSVAEPLMNKSLSREMHREGNFSIDFIENRPGEKYLAKILVDEMAIKIATSKINTEIDCLADKFATSINETGIDCLDFIGKTFKLTLSHRGQETLDSEIDKLIFKIDTQQKDPEVHSLKDIFRDIFIELSDKPVKPGDSWKGKNHYKYQTPQGPDHLIDYETTYTAGGLENFNNRICVKINGTIDGSVTIEGRETTGEEQQMHGKISGTIEAYFDHQKGVLVKASKEMTYLGRMTYRISGTGSTSFPYEETRTTDMELKK